MVEGVKKGKFISPNDALQQAKDLMLEGRDPESEDDWILIVNCWGGNFIEGTEVSLCNILRLLLKVPLNEDQVTAIAEFQARKK